MNKQLITPPKKVDFGIDPRIKLAERQLANLIAGFMGAPVTEGLVQGVEDTLEEFRVHKMLAGIKLPRMRVIALPQSGYIQIWPSEMDHKEMQVRIKNLIIQLEREGRQYEPEELAKAIRRGYPDYSPSMSLKLN